MHRATPATGAGELHDEPRLETDGPGVAADGDSGKLRERALAVLASLERARDRCIRELRDTNRRDPMAQVTGRSSLDRAIASARRAVDVLDRAAGPEVRVEMGRGGSAEEPTAKPPVNGRG